MSHIVQESLYVPCDKTWNPTPVCLPADLLPYSMQCQLVRMQYEIVYSSSHSCMAMSCYKGHAICRMNGPRMCTSSGSMSLPKWRSSQTILPSGSTSRDDKGPFTPGEPRSGLYAIATTCTNSGLQALLRYCHLGVSAAWMLCMLTITKVCIWGWQLILNITVS